VVELKGGPEVGVIGVLLLEGVKGSVGAVFGSVFGGSQRSELKVGSGIVVDGSLEMVEVLSASVVLLLLVLLVLLARGVGVSRMGEIVGDVGKDLIAGFPLRDDNQEPVEGICPIVES